MTRERKLLLGALGAWLVVEIVMLVAPLHLGHDEAQYALAARGDHEWQYVSPGTVAIARVGVALGASDLALRLLPALLSLAFVLAVWLAGRVAFGERTGALAAAVMAGAHPLALRGTELLSDFPSAACLLAGIALLARELSRDGGPSWRLVGTAPLFAGAFYIRYGHAPVIALASITAALLWWRAVIVRPLRVVATLALFVLLLVPHALHSLDATGSVIGVLELSRQMPSTGRTAGGLIDYVTANPLAMFGALVAPLLVVGVYALVALPRRVAVLYGAVAIGQLVIVGMTGSAQPRYVCVAAALLVACSLEVVARALDTRPKLGRVALAAIACTWLYDVAVAWPVNARRERARAPLAVAAAAIARDAAGAPCLVGGTELTLVMWESRCEGAYTKPPYYEWPHGPRHYVIAQEPSDVVDVAGIAAVQHESAIALPLPWGTVHAWRLTSP